MPIITLKNAVGPRADGKNPQKIAQIRHHPAGEFKFADHPIISISPCTSSELGELCAEIDLRNGGSLRRRRDISRASARNGLFGRRVKEAGVIEIEFNREQCAWRVIDVGSDAGDEGRRARR